MRLATYICQRTALIANDPSSIVAVQGLGAHPYYTWVKKPDAVKGKKTGKLSLSSDTAQTATEIAEIMWLRDLLPKSVCNARIASYSYESDWRHDVKTNLRNCGEQLLNVLHQSRAGDQVGRIALKIVFLQTDKHDTGKAATADNGWA